jgi:transcriptional regulator with XRE-family HTH domain
MNSRKNEAWGKMLLRAREQNGLSQGQLADLTGISARTVYRAERLGMVPGAQIIIRLADALKADPYEWLRLANETVASDFVENVRQHFTQTARSFAGMALEEFIEGMKERRCNLGADDPGLMCVCYASEPAARYREAVAKGVADLIVHGLHLGMFFPYPIQDKIERRLLRNDYARSCRDTWEAVRDLAVDYRAMVAEVAPNAEAYVKLFIPNAEAMLFVPPASSFALRPTYVALQRSSLEPEDELCGIIAQIPRDRQRDHEDSDDAPRWYSMKDDLRPAWRAYFADAIDTWQNSRWDGCITPNSWQEYNLVEWMGNGNG